MGDDRTIAQFRRSVDALAGVYYRIDRGALTGRNADATAATMRAHYIHCRDAIAADARTDEAPLCAYLDSHPRLAAKWNRLERRYNGLEA